MADRFARGVARQIDCDALALDRRPHPNFSPIASHHDKAELRRGWWATCKATIDFIMSTRPLLLALLLGAALSACTDSEPPPPSLAAFDPVLSLDVQSKAGDAVSHKIAVSGRERLAVPDTRNWKCGTPLNETIVSNIAWFELNNPTQDTLSVTLELDGMEKTHPMLFVYASKNASLRDCLTFSGQRKLAGMTSVIVEPTSYAAVLLATGMATGVYTLGVTTDHVISP